MEIEWTFENDSSMRDTTLSMLRYFYIPMLLYTHRSHVWIPVSRI
jgi:hypothetical protein